MTTPFDLDLPTVFVVTEYTPGDPLPDNAAVAIVSNGAALPTGEPPETMIISNASDKHRPLWCYKCRRIRRHDWDGKGWRCVHKGAK